jgi:hypothetical protein
LGGASLVLALQAVNNNQPSAKKTQTFSIILFFEQRNAEQKK